MALPRTKQFELSRTHLFNIGGVAMIALSVALALQNTFASEPETALCETRYANGVLFGYTKQKGVAMAPEELQSRLGGLDRGLVKNTRIVKDDGVPYGFALEVQLKRAAAEEDDQSRSGIGLTWVPRQLASATAACLSYSVWTPEGFKPGEGGVLPGLVSDSGVEVLNVPVEVSVLPIRVDQPADNPDGDAPPAQLTPFSLRPQWRADGSLIIWQTPNIGQRGLVLVDPKAALKPGRWVRIEQEVVLNTPGQSDGTLRMWVDGKIVYEQSTIGYRSDEVQSFQAVIGDIYNLRHGVWSGAPAHTRIKLSPLELRLR